jgi:hypothetical protein
MPSKPEERLDRRDFMIASTATIGASAALVVNAGSANAQTSATSSVSPAPGAPSATVYTGDTIQGKKVVSALDVNDLEPRQKHLLYFQGVEMPTGQHWYVSVTVAIQRNSFGEVVAEYTSSVAGEVTGQRSDAMSEPGNPLAFILFHKATSDGGETYPE